LDLNSYAFDAFDVFLDYMYGARKQVSIAICDDNAMGLAFLADFFMKIL